MREYHIGSRLKDQAGNDWTVTFMWQFENYLCLGLIGTFNPNLMGGTRVKLYQDNIFNF